jgi:predicted phage terminase large subunit-like protein
MTILAEPSVSLWEAAARLFEPPKPKARWWASPLDLACDLDPRMVRTPALECINAALVRLIDKPGQGRLAVFVPPQEGKSTICSFWNPLWLLINDPDMRIIAVSYNAEKSRDWGSAVKSAIENYSGIDGTVDLGLRLRTDSRAAGRWNVEGFAGGLYCAGIESGITGRPGDYIVVDDPTKNLQEAQSTAKREKVTSTYRGAIVPRLGSPNSKMVWIQTLWHESETIQDILANEGSDWEVIRIPAIADSPDDPIGRKIGEPMLSARGHRDWARVRRDVGEYVFAALYQQRPAPAEGGMFRRLHWRYWSPAPALLGERIDCGGRIWPIRECWRFITGDLAASMKTAADWTVAAAWALTLDGDLVLLDRVRAKVGEGGHYGLFRPLAERWQVDTAFVEATQHSMTLTAEATRGGLHVTPLTADTDKFTRALPYSARVSGGRVWLPAGAPWLGEWVDEHAGFPGSSKHDDQVDVGSYAARVAITKWSPPPPKPLPKPESAEVDLMSVEM